MAKGIEDVVLIGGVSWGLRPECVEETGMRVMVVEFFPRLLPRQLDVTAPRGSRASWKGWDFPSG